MNLTPREFADLALDCFFTKKANAMSPSPEMQERADAVEFQCFVAAMGAETWQMVRDWLRRHGYRDTQTVEIVVCCAYDRFGILEFAQLLKESTAEIPAEYQASAKIELESGCEDDPSRLVIDYQRPLTHTEKMANATKALDSLCLMTRLERQQYEALRAKYEPKA